MVSNGSSEFIFGALNCNSLMNDAVEQLIKVLLNEENKFLDDIIALSETKINAYGLQVGANKSHLLFSSAQGSYYGTGFLVHSRWSTFILRFQPLSDRLSYMDMCIRGCYIRFISVYMPSSTEADTGRRTQYRDILFNKMSKLIGETQTPFIIGGDFNARIGEFRKTDGDYVGEEKALSNFTSELKKKKQKKTVGEPVQLEKTEQEKLEEELRKKEENKIKEKDKKMKKRNWPGQQCITFSKLKKLYIVNRFTSISRNLRYTHQGSRENPARGSFSIKHDVFKLGTKNGAQFSTDHRLIRYKFHTSVFSRMKTQFTSMDNNMEISFVLEWAAATRSNIICILVKQVTCTDEVKLLLEQWGEELKGVTINNCKYSFYRKDDTDSDMLVFSKTKKEAKKIIQDSKKLHLKPYFITNLPNLELEGGTQENALDYQNGLLNLSLKHDSFNKESAEITRKKWDSLLKWEFPTLTIVREMLLNNYRNMFKSPLLERLLFVKDRWMELITSEALWESTYDMYENKETITNDARLNKNIIDLLPLADVSERIQDKEKIYLILLEYSRTEKRISISSMETTLKEKCKKHSQTVIRRSGDKLLISLKDIRNVRTVFKHVIGNMNFISKILFSDPSSYAEFEKQFSQESINVTLENQFMEFDGIILELNPSCDIYVNMMLATFMENEDELTSISQITDKVKLYVENVQRKFVQKLLFVPLEPVHLAQIADTESCLLREITGNFEEKSSEAFYKPLGIEDFRYAYYRAKWEIARCSTARTVLKDFKHKSIWMRDIKWFGEKWMDIAKNENAWKIAFDIYTKVNLRPLDETDTFFGVVQAERQHL